MTTQVKSKSEGGTNVVALSGCRISRPATFAGHVEIVLAGAAPRGFSAHLSDSLGLCLKIGAAHAVTSDGRKLTYPANAVCVRHPGCVWSSEVAAVGFVSIDVARALLPRDLEPRPMQFLRGDVLDMQRMAAALETGESRLQQDAALASLIEWLSRRNVLEADSLREETSRTRVMRQAEALLRAELDRTPSLQELAEATNTNRFVLLRYFKKELGIGPHGYLVRLRVERARDLLARGQPPIDVAVAVGFADQAHLNRHFTRILGITPGEYARQVRSLAPVPARSEPNGQFRSRPAPRRTR
ncbi:MAG TPA: AraC family transcriptional regulator [Polyangiaceae bacterium]|nr:AraC family transcriptional regulator [Polyangiaceae bacterium]